MVAERAFLDLVEQFPVDDRLVGCGGTPDPLLAWPDDGAAGALVVPAQTLKPVYLGLRSIAWICERLQVWGRSFSSFLLRVGGG